MPKRTLPQQVIGTSNTAQPFFSTIFNGAVASQTINANRSYVSVPVPSSSGFRPGDYVALSPGTTNFEYGKVIAIPDGTHLGILPYQQGVVKGTLGAHASGEFIALSTQVAAVYAQRVAGDTNTLYFGGPGLNPGASPPYNVIAEVDGVASGQPGEFADSTTGGNKNALGTYWVYGTSGTVWNPSITV